MKMNQICMAFYPKIQNPKSHQNEMVTGKGKSGQSISASPLLLYMSLVVVMANHRKPLSLSLSIDRRRERTLCANSGPMRVLDHKILA